MSQPLAELDWRNLKQLPNVVFIRSRHGHQTIADALIPLLEASPLYADHVAQVFVHALSGPKALASGLCEALNLCERDREPWCVALVRGGGNESAMDKFVETLEDARVRPLLETLSRRMIFAAGHARDSERVKWLRSLVLSFGTVPNEAATRFVDLLRRQDVLRTVHDAAGILHVPDNGIPIPSELHQARRVRQLGAFRQAASARYEDALKGATRVSEASFFEILFRGGLLMDFLRSGKVDAVPVAFSADHELYVADAAYPLDEWRQIFERMSVEEDEVEEAIERPGLNA